MKAVVSPVVTLLLQQLLPVAIQQGGGHQVVLIHQVDYFDVPNKPESGGLWKNILKKPLQRHSQPRGSLGDTF